MKVAAVAVDLIDVPPRVRPARPAAVAALAKDIKVRGQRQPIELRRKEDGRFELISGLHRLEAHRLLGLTEIHALIHPKGWKVAARLRDELMENLVRAELYKLERAEYLARLRDASLEEFQEPAILAGGGKSASWAVAVAERTDMSARTVEHYASIGDMLDAEAADALRGTEFENKLNELDALARLTPEKQRRAVALLTREDDPARSVAEAIAQMEGRVEPRQSPEERLATRMVDGWRRAPREVRRSFALSLGEQDIALIASFKGYALVPAGADGDGE